MSRPIFRPISRPITQIRPLALISVISNIHQISAIHRISIISQISVILWMFVIGQIEINSCQIPQDEAGFVAIMAGLNLAYPKKIDESLPANMVCGLYNLPEKMADWVK